MYRVGVIGDKDSVMGFRALGLAVMVAEDREAVQAHLSTLLEGGFAIVYITEPAAALVPEELELFRSRKLPAIVPIPSTRGTLGIGMAQVKDTVKKAAGVDILGFDR